MPTPSRRRDPAAVGVRHVAELAGVSRQTVSRVLNDHPSVAPETRERVTRAMVELGYRVNNAARALGTRRTRTLGILASDTLHYGPARSIAAVEASAREAGYWVTMAFADAGNTESVVAALDHLRAQGVEGIVAIAPHARTLDALAVHVSDLPVVTLHSAGRDAHSFSVDQYAGARRAVSHLAELGHVRIAHLAGPSDWLEADARRRGYEDELAERGLGFRLVVPGDWTARAGYLASERIQDAGATAVFVANDQMALGLLSGLQRLGLAIPRDVSVVGFDDLPDAAYYSPALTTVRPDIVDLARAAVAAVTGESEPPPVPAPAVLVERSSVARPPA